MLSIYERLLQGNVIRKKEEAERFHVNEKSIQRDIEDLRNHLSEFHLGPSYSLDYDTKKRGYVFHHHDHVWLDKMEVLAIAKVLLESRAFPKDELKLLLGKLSLQSSLEDRKIVDEILRNEFHHYVSLKHNKPLKQTIWDLAYAVRINCCVKITYKKENGITVNKLVKPVGLIFSEFYFYLAAFLDGYDYKFPTIYRLDRIDKHQLTEQHFKIPESERFEEGQLRKRTQFMYPGKLMNIQFRFWGPSSEAVMDRIPTAKIVSYGKDGFVFEAEVYGRGIKMWLLSQAESLEVLKPMDLREEMKHSISQMLKVYSMEDAEEIGSL